MYKTYFSVACGIVTSAIYGLGYIDTNTFTVLLSIFGFAGVGSLRIAIKNLIK